MSNENETVSESLENADEALRKRVREFLFHNPQHEHASFLHSLADGNGVLGNYHHDRANAILKGR